MPLAFRPQQRTVPSSRIAATGVNADGLVRTSPLQPVEPGLARHELLLDAAVRLFSITIHRTSLDSPDEVTFEVRSIEADEAARCAQFLRDSDPAAADALT